MKLFKKLFDHEYKELEKFRKIADQIVALDEEMQKLSDKELKNKTEEFKERLSKGETLDDIKVEAFAVAREAAYRVIGEKPFYVQILGGLAIHEGNIAEMRTGEGKTLTSTMPAYLNALEGKGVHIVTVNEYLAGRDANWMGAIYKFLGLTVGVNLRELGASEKKEVYNCDITYSTNNEIGFDYLRDNMVINAKDRVQRPLNFAIVDEVDSILIDEARTPLIISGGHQAAANLYIEDYCRNPISDDYRTMCNTDKKLIGSDKVYLCLSTLQGRKAIKEVTYDETVSCKGLVLYDYDSTRNKFSNGKTYLYCESEYMTEGGNTYKTYADGC